WRLQYSMYQRAGGDTFLIIKPNGISIQTCSAEIITQITSHGSRFPKPTKESKVVELYGPNIITTEGAQWRTHRKIMAPSFSEDNNRLVWDETLYQARAMVGGWGLSDTEESATLALKELQEDTMLLPLNIISRAVLGIKLEWPKHNKKSSNNRGSRGDKMNMEGHSLTFQDALSILLENLPLIFLLGKFLLKQLPFKAVRHAYTAFSEWQGYMQDMILSKREQLDRQNAPKQVDILSLMLESHTDVEEGAESKGRTISLTNEEILGNTFIMTLAGHETTGDALFFAMVELAMNPQSQRELQQNLDDILGDRPLDKWNYDLDLPKLLAGVPGAVFSEILRVYPPVIQIPKRTLPGSPQTLLENNQQITIPPDVHIKLSVIGAHRNPNSWASWTWRANSHVSGSDSEKDLGEFDPCRWLAAPNENPDQVSPSTIDSSRPQASSSPKPGAYLPFSEGSRSCLGRRFAQVEMVLTLAVIFKYWTIELVPEPPVDEEELAKNAVSTAEKGSTWLKAREKLKKEIRDNLSYILTLKYNAGEKKQNVPTIRLTRRGKEYWT
ncbi:hypothetical protein COCVIDRAFT_105323, partial [Bipolaris victoriae FI3]